jgi:hypothetical protein
MNIYIYDILLTPHITILDETLKLILNCKSISREMDDIHHFIRLQEHFAREEDIYDDE